MHRSSLRFQLAMAFAVLCATGAGLTASMAQVPDERRDCRQAALAGAQVEPSDGAAAQTLAIHNEERARLGLPPLAWSYRLQSEALEWAQTLARRGALEHASKQARGGSGENLWMGTAGRFLVEEMVGRFVEEKQHYRHAPFPHISHTGNWSDAGHYTQVIWRDTRELGCALAQGNARDVLVCRYFPAGNVQGRQAY